MSKRNAAPVCPECHVGARFTTGAEIYGRQSKFAEKGFWKCDGCGGYVGCHGSTRRPLGTPAGPELRKARHLLHEQMLDPLWMNADTLDAYDGREATDHRARKMIQNRARSRVYAFLADAMGLPPELTHTGMFDLEQCRAAWRALRGVTYATIRTWAKMREDQNVIPFPKRKA